MAARRKLQSEIDICLKKVEEGLDYFHELWDKAHKLWDKVEQREKIAAELKKEIKKLQRHREQVKNWVTKHPDLLNKEPLIEARRKIEKEMERFKNFEKEVKTKTYSKVGLSLKKNRLSPEQRKAIDWLCEQRDALKSQLAELEEQLDKLQRKQRKKKSSQAQQEEDILSKRIEKHKWHLVQLRDLSKRIEKGRVDPKQLEALKDDIQYYVEEAAVDEEFWDNDLLYDGVEELEVPEEQDDPADEEEEEPERSPSPPPVKKKEKRKKKTKEKKTKKTKRKKKSSTKESSTPTTATPITAASSTPIASATPIATTPIAAQTPEPQLDSRTKWTKMIEADASKHRRTLVTDPSDPALMQASSIREFNRIPNRNIPSSVSPAITSISPATTVSMSHSEPVPIYLSGNQPQSQTPTINPINVMGSGSVPVPPSLTPTRQESGTRVPDFQSIMMEEERMQKKQQELQKQQRESGAQEESQNVWAAGTPFNRSSSFNSGLDRKPTTPTFVNHGPHTHMNNILGPLPLEGTDDPLRMPNFPVHSMQAQSSFVENPLQHTGTLTSQATDYHPHAPLNESHQNKLRQINYAHQNMPQAPTRRSYFPRNPVRVPDYFPLNPQSTCDDPEFVGKYDVDTLFFMFHYSQGTHQQYLAAQELKKRSWRYHKKFLTWFQRHTEPKVATNAYEQGAYIYFDYESSWCQRVKNDFCFEYQYLEDS